MDLNLNIPKELLVSDISEGYSKALFYVFYYNDGPKIGPSDPDEIKIPIFEINELTMRRSSLTFDRSKPMENMIELGGLPLYLKRMYISYYPWNRALTLNYVKYDNGMHILDQKCSAEYCIKGIIDLTNMNNPDDVKSFVDAIHQTILDIIDDYPWANILVSSEETDSDLYTWTNDHLFPFIKEREAKVRKLKGE